MGIGENVGEYTGQHTGSSGQSTEEVIPPVTGDAFLAFSDLISGPSTGIGDGLGSGVIVTVWGFSLGSSQGTSTITFTDSASTEHTPHIYYWKNADGTSPSGPANLYESHGMQEIAFSVPLSPNGAGTIKVRVNAEDSNTLPFTVRSGNIYHVKSTGSDSNPGSFDLPWRNIEKIATDAVAGSTSYIHDVNIGSSNSENAFYWNNNPAASSLAAQFGIIAYPGNQPTFMAQKGVSVRNDGMSAMVAAKLDVYSSNYKSTDSNDRPSGGLIWSGATYGINTTKDGRVVANAITNIPGGCASKFQGAINGDGKFADNVGNAQIIGNEIYDYGCAGSSKLHHTTYLSIRSRTLDRLVEPWAFHYNYLHDNHAKFGIHQFDQDQQEIVPNTCGDMSGPVYMTNNVVVNQGSAGLSVGCECGWTADFYLENNVLINVGNACALKADGTLDGPELGGINIRNSGMTGDVFIRNNLVYTWTTDGSVHTGMAAIGLFGSNATSTLYVDDNIFYTDINHTFVHDRNGSTPIIGKNNIWYYSGGATSPPTNSSYTFTGNITDDPLISVSGRIITLDANSPAVNAGFDNGLLRDVYGAIRDRADIGPVEYK